MSKARERIMNDPNVQSAILASQFARESGLPAGNMWEAGIAHKIGKELRIYTRDSVEAKWRFQLGL